MLLFGFTHLPVVQTFIDSFWSTPQGRRPSTLPGFGLFDQIINAATLITSGPLLNGFLLFQRQFVQSFMRAGIK